MRSLCLPWRRQSDSSHTEPVLGSDHALRVSDVDCAELPADAVSESVRTDSDVLGELGIGSTDDAAAHAYASSSTPDAGTDSTDTLIEKLHAQYWRALVDPHALITAGWAPLSEVDEPTPRAAASDSHDKPDALDDRDSIETLLFGNRTLEDLFERLDEQHTGPALDDEAVPEILRLFAPPEYQAAAAQRGPALPPPLTRREHHALSVDSPLLAPLRKAET